MNDVKVERGERGAWLVLYRNRQGVPWLEVASYSRRTNWIDGEPYGPKAAAERHAEKLRAANPV